MGAIPQYRGALGYTEERVIKIERRKTNVKKLMVKDLMDDLEKGNRVDEVVKIASMNESEHMPQGSPTMVYFSSLLDQSYTTTATEVMQLNMLSQQAALPGWIR